MKTNTLKVLVVVMWALSQQPCSVDHPVPLALAAEQTTRGKEIKGTSHALAPAPDECLQTLRAFLSYCFDGGADILTDAASQDRLLTPALKQQILENERMSARGQVSTFDKHMSRVET